jgi:hypothetical protein
MEIVGEVRSGYPIQLDDAMGRHLDRLAGEEGLYFAGDFKGEAGEALGDLEGDGGFLVGAEVFEREDGGGRDAFEGGRGEGEFWVFEGGEGGRVAIAEEGGAEQGGGGMAGEEGLAWDVEACLERIGFFGMGRRRCRCRWRWRWRW